MRTFFLRKTVSRFALPLLCFVLALSGLSGCAKAASTVSARLRPDMSIVIDGSARDFYNASGQEVHPILYDGTTYLPVRAIGELMGKNVDWNQTTKTVTLSGSRTAASTAGTPDTAAKTADVAAEIRDDFTVVVDGVTRTFADANGKTVYPLLYSGSTYLPVRAVGELMGKTVAWDGGTSTVTLSGGLVTDADSFSGGTGSETNTPVSTAPNGLISLEDAKAKALEHAGVTAGDAFFVEQELDWDDGRQIYEIEFYTAGGKEYDYEIDAKTGEILEFDYDAEHMPSFTGSDGKPVTTIITREKAQEIALGKVPGANASHVTKCKTDMEDGRPVYEVEIVYNAMEYDFEIDAATGTILEMDADRND
ncbi:MAG: PepSY domain-containing protein [Oscillospiraceae bacterium]|nr:PepSY domain-containing protein [Oscillospiraceae bacterium]